MIRVDAETEFFTSESVEYVAKAIAVAGMDLTAEQWHDPRIPDWVKTKPREQARAAIRAVIDMRDILEHR